MRQEKLNFRNAISFSPAILICALALFSIASPVTAQQPLLTRHIGAEITNQQTPRLGLVPEDRILKLSILLPLRNESQLDDLLSRLYDSTSPLYHHWLSVQEFTDRFGPTPEDYETVVNFAKANGMKVTVMPANRRLVGVESSVANINRAFHVTLGFYQHPYEARTFYSPDREPSVDLSVPLLHIAGLSNIATAHSMLRYNATPEAVHTEITGSGPGGAFYGSDMRAAYYGGTALTGAGQSIGIFGADYNISDVETYFSSEGQSFNPSTVQDYSGDGTVNSCGTGCDDGEPVADITESLSMAPGVNSVIVYFGASQEEVFNTMASVNAAKQLSTSIIYWYSPDPGTTFDGIFKEFSAQGQNFFSASGDSGAYYSSSSVFTTPGFPTDDPYVVAVGGTDLTTNGAGGSWKSESAWIGSGGGLDLYQSYPIPSYQQLSGVIDSANQGSTTIRNIPDVSIDANTDSFYCINGNACTCCLGGTSLAAPRWAGFMALVNEQAVDNGNSTVGFLNPTVYAIGTSSSYTSEFHDITTGNNDNSEAGFNAVTGYDLVTGWGSPNGQALINALAGSTQSFTLSATPGTVTVTQGSSGTSTVTVTGVNSFTGSVTLTASGLPSGVTAAFGTNPTTGSSVVTFTASSTATAGASTVTITGTSGSLTASTSIALTITAASCAAVPSAPTGLAASGTSSSGTTLTWTADTAPANCSISSYTVLKNGSSIGTATATSFAVAGLSAATTYSFTLEAADSDGVSATSSALSVTTSGSGSGEAPYGGTAAAIPGTVKAENYDTGGQGVAYSVLSVNGTDNSYRTDGVDLETTTATGGGNDLGWTKAGQWFKYTVNVATAGTYTVTFAVASNDGATDAFHLSNAAGTNLTGSVNVPNTGGWETWKTVTATVTLPAGTQTLTLNQDNPDWNFYSATFAAASEAPYGGTAAAIPGTVKAENYDTGGQGVAYSVLSVNGTDNSYRTDGVDLETTTATGGGNDLGWTKAGQWFKYTVNVATAGTYTVTFAVASNDGATDAFHLSNAAGTNLTGSVNVPNTGGWETWKTVTATVTLPAGTQTLTLNQDNPDWNFYSATFAAASEAPYGGTAAAIPGTVKAENYDTGGQGVAYSVLSVNGTDNSYRTDGVDLETTTATGGGNDLGWTKAGQWFKYTVNVATAGTYTVTFAVASNDGATDAFHLSNAAGTNLTGSVNVPNTGGWETWKTVTATVTLPAGTQTLTLNQDNPDWNFYSAAFAVQ